MNVIKDITIDLLRPKENVFHVVQEDSSRQIRLTLLENNLPFYVAADLDEGEELLKFVEFKKADGHGGIYDTTSLGDTAVVLEDSDIGNVWLVTLDGQCFTCPGWTQINVRFETEAGRRVHTFRIMVDVEPTASSDTESTDWNDLSSIADLRNAVTALFETRVSMEAKQALLNLLAHVAYVDEHGQDYYDELETELFRTAGLVSISAVFNQGSAVIYDTDSLETLRQYLTVTATYEDLSTREITGYTLSGTLTAGTSTITVSYGGKTDSFAVSVTHNPVPIAYQQVSGIRSLGNTFIQTDVVLPQYNSVLVDQEYESAASGQNARMCGVMQTFSPSATGLILYFNASEQLGAYAGTASLLSPTTPHARREVGYVVDSSGLKAFYVSNGERVYGTAQSISRTYQTNPLGIFGCESGQLYKGTIYSLVVYDQYGDALANFVPVYRKADSVPGFYDTIGENFYSGSATDFEIVS